MAIFNGYVSHYQRVLGWTFASLMFASADVVTFCFFCFPGKTINKRTSQGEEDTWWIISRLYPQLFLWDK